MRRTILPIFFLVFRAVGGVSGQCRLLDRTTHLVADPIVAEEFNYAVPGHEPQYTAGDYDPDTPANWANNPEFLSRWGDGRPVLPTNWDAESGAATTHYYSPAALEMTTSGTLKIHATAIAPAYSYRGDNPWANYRNIFYRTGHLVADPALGSSVGRSLTYGLYEIRCKFPANPLASQRGLMPTFWLIGGGSELDIFDQVDGTSNSRLNSAVIDWTNAPQTVACSNLAIKHGPDLAAGFNLFSMLWTPDGVTFFLNERAYYHVPAHVLPTHPGLMRLYLELRTTDLAISTGQGAQTSGSQALIDHAEMEVDHIRVYGLKNPDTAHAAYLTNPEYTHHSVVTNDASGQNRQEHVLPVAGSIAVNPNDANEFFFIGTDNAVYRAARSATSGQWNTQPLASGQSWAWRAGGDLVYSAALDAIVYRGTDNRVQQYQRPAAGGRWRHSYVLPKRRSSATVNTSPNSLAVAANGDLFFIAADGRINWCRRAVGGRWATSDISYAYLAEPRASGNLLTRAHDGGTTVLYQSTRNKLRQFRWDADHYTHAYVRAAGPGLSVRPGPGSVAQSPAGDLFYVDQTNHLVHVRDVADSTRTRLPLPVLPASSLGWDERSQQLVYADPDGSLRAYRLSATGTWASVKIDDYYPNTDQFRLFTVGSAPAGGSSIAIGPAGDIFYRAHANELQYFAREACTVFTAPAPGNTSSILAQVRCNEAPAPATKAIGVTGRGLAPPYAAAVQLQAISKDSSVKQH